MLNLNHAIWILPQEKDYFWHVDLSLNKASKLKPYQLEKTISNYSIIISCNTKELITAYNLAFTNQIFICLSIFKALSTKDYQATVSIPQFRDEKSVLEWVNYTKKYLFTYLRKNKLTKLFFIECRLMKILVKMQYYGIPFNKSLWQQELKLLENKKNIIYEKMLKICQIEEGFKLFGESKISFHTLINDPKLQGYKNLLKEYKEIYKITSVYGESFLHSINNDRLKGTFNQLGCSSGRMSCSNHNLQALPSVEYFQKCLKAINNHLLLYCDYSGFELRILAALSKDKVMSDIFAQEKDIHEVVAKMLFNDASQRARAKVINFGIVYGMGANTLAQKLDCSLQEAKNLLHNYLNLFTGIKKYLNYLEELALQNGFASTSLNRHMMLKDKNSKTLARNLPIQGCGADILKLAMIYIDKKLKASSYSAYLINSIHDEIVIETLEKDTLAIKNIATYCMQQAFIKILQPSFGVQVNVICEK